jgi:hypothetical protein
MQEPRTETHVTTGQGTSDVRKANKKQLLALLVPTLEENECLRKSVARLSKLSMQTPILRHVTRPDDFVPAGWTEQHRIEIPRADGLFESSTAWVRITHGVIVNAGLKNQSILSVMISMNLLDQGANRHGSLYTDWKAAFLSRLDPTKSGGKGDDNPDAWSKEDRYSKLLRRVDPDYLSAMDCMVAPRPKAKHLIAFQFHQKEFAEAFELVAKAMNEINRDAEEALKAAETACADAGAPV